MHLIIRYPNGRIADAILLAANPELIRIVLRDSADTQELWFREGAWFSESGEPLEIESVTTMLGLDEPRPRCMAAGA